MTLKVRVGQEILGKLTSNVLALPKSKNDVRNDSVSFSNLDICIFVSHLEMRRLLVHRYGHLQA